MAEQVSTGLEARIALTRGDFSLDLGLRVLPGRTIALLGPNGSGKSTVVDALAGLVPIEKGKIVLGGRVLDDPAENLFVEPQRRRVGVVFQDLVLFPHLNVLKNVAFGLRSRGVSKRSAHHKAGECLEQVGLGDQRSRRIGQLSGGQAQRVALARALATDPEMLVLDEPLSALDVSVRLETRRMLFSHMSRFPGPRLIITHDPTEAFLLADQVVIIEEGRVTQAGEPDQIRLRPLTRYAADLAGVNLLVGQASSGAFETEGHSLAVTGFMHGPAIAVIHPRAISLHVARPAGSPRNVWQTVINRIERHGEVVRVQTGAPLPLTAEVTGAALSALAVSEGSAIWLSLKATEITLQAS